MIYSPTTIYLGSIIIFLLFIIIIETITILYLLRKHLMPSDEEIIELLDGKDE